MKYIDAEKLKVKIIELRSESCISEEDDYYEFAKADVLDIIDSLQQEQPEVDLKKEIANLEFMGNNDARDVQMIAHHFYELGLKAGK